MQLRTVLGTTFLLMATAVLASAQGVKPSAPPPTAARVVTATVKTRTLAGLSKADDERVGAAFRPAFEAYKKDKDAKKLMKAGASLSREARQAYMDGVIGVVASTNQIATRYSIESARLSSVALEAPGPNGCDVRAEVVLGIRRLGPIPQGTPVLIAGTVEQLAPAPPPAAVGVVLTENPASSVTEVVVPLVFNNRSANGTTCRPLGFAAELGVVGGLGQSYRVIFENGALLLEAPPPPPSSSNCPVPPLVKCRDGRCVLGGVFCDL
ncbi:MAG: hypothetical protein JST00_07100 [Deltaproteobacteria bacterium]|nr:hypothetical protein [Deltaproteobacteria bacterium]